MSNTDVKKDNKDTNDNNTVLIIIIVVVSIVMAIIAAKFIGSIFENHPSTFTPTQPKFRAYRFKYK